MDRTGLKNAAAADRAVMAVTELRILWERADYCFREGMVEQAAESWSLNEEEKDNIANFLCEFVMDLRITLVDEDGEEEEDDDF